MLRVHVLGELALELDGTRLDPPASRRARSLLGLLATDRRMHARSELAARFWPDVLDESARTSLRAALSGLRRALGPDADRYLLADRERAGLADAADVWTDAAEFERLVSEGRPGDAIELWRGDLLSGLDDDWVLTARDEWRERVASVLAQLAAEAESGGDLAGSVAYTRRAVALDPLSEEPQRELIRRLAAAGDRGAALTAYDRYAERLRTELRVVPSPATRALVEEIRRDGAGEPEAAAPQPPAAAPALAVPAAGTVTLLFTDLVGSTELLEELGDDEAERLRRVHFALLRDVALSHAGQEVKNLGDGLMVAFASSIDAVGCAIGIQQAVQRQNEREGRDRLHVRVGLNVGEPIRDEGDYFGTPVVIAKRLCDCASGGQILASDLVRALVGSRGGYTFRPVGELPLKGISQPTPACELAWEPAGERRIPLPAELAREGGAFIGRDAPLRALQAAWDAARGGRSHVVAVAGEPGIGKTRLVAELSRAAHADGATVLLGRSYEETLIPYQPFVEALRHYVGACPVDDLRLQVGTRRPALAKLVPELAGADEAGMRRSDDPEGERYVLFDAVASLLRELSRVRPAILVLDDLHWADTPSLLLLRHLIATAQDAPLLVVATYRETEMGADLAAALAELRRARALDTVALPGLDAGDVGELIRTRTGADATDELVRNVADRTEGNPFFVEEIVRHLDGGTELAVPESVKDLLLRRLRRLDEPARKALAAAAVIGREFELELLARAIDADPDELVETMDEALGERVLVESPGAPGHYAFAHALISETIYEQLSATRRALLHRRAGEALEALRAGRLDEHSAELAHHFGEAGDAERRFDYAIRAGAAAVRVFAAEAAVEHYTDALETAERLGLSAASDRRVRRLHLDRGWAQNVSGDFEAALADYGMALEGARAAADRHLEMEALDFSAFHHKQFDAERSIERHHEALRIAEELGDEPAQLGILSHLALEHANQLDLNRALEDGERALALARNTGADVHRARAIDALKLAALQLGDLDRLEELTAELAEIERRHADLWYLQWTLLEAAFVPIGRGRWDEAAARLEEARAVNDRVRDPLGAPLIHDAFAWLARSRGDYGTALRWGREALEATTGGGRVWIAWTAAGLGWTLLDLRAPDEAVAVLERGVAAAGTRADAFRAGAHLAWARALAGDPDGAARAAADAEEVLAAMTAPAGGAFLFGFGAVAALARSHVAADQPERAEALVVPLLEAGTRSQWHEAVAVSALVLASCRTGDEAEQLLRRAVEVAAEHGLPGVEWEARAALAHITPAEEAERLRSESRAIVERLAAGVGDERRAGGLLAAS